MGGEDPADGGEVELAASPDASNPARRLVSKSQL